MLIWDEKNKEHIVRIDGEEKARITTNDFSLTSSNLVNESEIKTEKDIELDPHELKIHIFSKPTNLLPSLILNYALWVGTKGVDMVIPSGKTDWWETTEIK